MHETRAQTWCTGKTSGGEGGGSGDRDGEHMVTHGCFISMYDKIHYKKKKIQNKKILNIRSKGAAFSFWTGSCNLCIVARPSVEGAQLLGPGKGGSGSPAADSLVIRSSKK